MSGGELAIGLGGVSGKVCGVLGCGLLGGVLVRRGVRWSVSVPIRAVPLT